MPWTQRIDLTGPEGPPGPSIELQATSTHLQWRTAPTPTNPSPTTRTWSPSPPCRVLQEPPA